MKIKEQDRMLIQLSEEVQEFFKALSNVNTYSDGIKEYFLPFTLLEKDGTFLIKRIDYNPLEYKLNELDLINIGFIQDENNPFYFMKSISKNLHINLKVINNEIEIATIYNEDNHSIYKSRFKGTIDTLNELKILLKQLGL